MNHKVAIRTSKCLNCNICRVGVCPSKEECIGCGACYFTCPHEAVEMVERPIGGEIAITVDGRDVQAPGKITVKHALEILGFEFSKYPGEGIFAPCEVGGCWTCIVKINGEAARSCVTPVQEGMKIETRFIKENPRRLIYSYGAHPAGGVGTPLRLKMKGKGEFIEVVCFTCGCNFHCPQCQNWTIAYKGKPDLRVADPRSPIEAAAVIRWLREETGLDRMTVSGGESTLNRPWLVSYIRELKNFNPDPNARIHVDTNGSLLMPDYIDELIEAGMTDIGIDLKSIDLNTFMKITGIYDQDLADKYLTTAWDAVKYITERYKDRVFLGIGIPYNREFTSLEEIRRAGEKLNKIDPEIQVCILDYRGEFRSDFSQPSSVEMLNPLKVLKECGLKAAFCQTRDGYVVE